MNMTRKPVTSTHTKLMAILLWPTVSMTSGSVGAAASFTGTSAAVPVAAPVGSGPRGAGAGAGASAAAGWAAGGAGDASWARPDAARRAQTARPSPMPSPKLRNHFLLTSRILSSWFAARSGNFGFDRAGVAAPRRPVNAPVPKAYAAL